MDPTGDLSARVLLTHILSTETPRTPITRSASQQPSTSATRSSSRLRNKNAVPKTPQAILKHSQIHKLQYIQAIPEYHEKADSLSLIQIE
ncbi:hypothetical protein F7725_014274 [Dissostichus mawsoni]|uniref:Uncharacterized protein n=1 Tax=Dissostichus mawsoni TaxID=36200 RepID=A0A7J5YVY0_DISMA|nr:hypothetical protein F7725_014274 [Dissostichus mawsoni]